MTETLTLSLPLEAVEATWGVFDCARAATAAETAAAGFKCAGCAETLTAKVGGGTVAGTVVGRRSWPTEAWVFEGPYCQPCDKALAIKDGY